MRLQPIHSSISPRPRPPRDMSRMDIGEEQRMFIESQALEIFTEMSNVGASLPQILSAIYLSGMDAAIGAMKKRSTQ